MDTTTLLREARVAALRLAEGGGLATDGRRLAELVLELDAALSAGHAPPEGWELGAQRRELKAVG